MNKDIETITEFLKIEIQKQLLFLVDFNKKERTFLEFELEIQKSIKELGRSILEKMIPIVYGNGYEGSKVKISDEETYSCVLRCNPRNLKTIFGNIVIKRAYYQFDQDGSSLGLLDKRLDIHGYKISPALRYFAGLTGTVTTFREASDILQRLNGISLSSSEIDILTEQKANEAYKFHEEKIVNIELDCNGKILPADINADQENIERIIYLECDGCFVPTISEWRECKTLLLFETEKIEDKVQIKNKFYYSTTNGIDYFKKQVKIKLEEYCKQTRVKVVCVGDGAHWIWNMCRELIPQGRVEILDWYHVAERIGIICAELFPENESEKTAAMTEILGYFYADKYDDAVVKLNQLYEKTKDKQLKEKIYLQLAYFESNKDRIHYPEYVKKGYLIGSGAVESANKYVIQRRLKLPGIRWTNENANNMAHIRTEYINGNIEEIYNIKQNPLTAIT